VFALAIAGLIGGHPDETESDVRRFHALSALRRPPACRRLLLAAPGGAPPQTVSHGLFSNVKVQRPDGTPQQFVLLLQNRAEGPSPAEQALAERMVGAGAMVASVPLPPFYQRLAAQDGQCTYPGGAFENLSRSIQAQDHLPAYLLPLLVGTGPRRRSPMPPWPRRRPAPSPAACPSACARACC
jgi:type IV secretory pathway VirJ component